MRRTADHRRPENGALPRTGLTESRAVCTRAFVLLVVTLAIAAEPAPAAPITEKLFPLTVRVDPRDAAPSPLDIRRVSLGQRGTELWVTVKTHAAFRSDAIGADGLCVTLRGRGRLCFGDRVLTYGRATNGALGPARIVPAVFRRPDARTVSARLYPHALGLPFGRLRWSVTSRSADREDRVPDTGTYRARIGALGGPRCFGGAARERRRTCVNPELRRSVIPAPSRAEITPDAPCRRVKARYDVLEPCAFGDLSRRRKPAIALVGDSHAAHWRAAVDVAAKAAGDRAVSLTAPGCTFSTEVYPAPAPIPARCRVHSLEALTWLRRHTTVKTIVTSSSAGRGLSVGGYLAIWSRVPRSVRRIFVIRDVPRVSYATADCVRAVRRRGRSSVGVCSVSRGGAFPADTSAQAAAAAGGRVRLLDFTRYFCDASRCYPVVGGAYVYRDFNHMNPVFSATLGPYLLRALGRS
jgi:SGNH domain-containing protein